MNFDKYIDKKLTDKLRKKIMEEYSTFKVYFHPSNSLLMIDDQPNRIRVFYDNQDDDIITEITQG